MYRSITFIFLFVAVPSVLGPTADLTACHGSFAELMDTHRRECRPDGYCYFQAIDILYRAKGEVGFDDLEVLYVYPSTEYDYLHPQLTGPHNWRFHVVVRVKSKDLILDPVASDNLPRKTKEYFEAMFGNNNIPFSEITVKVVDAREYLETCQKMGTHAAVYHASAEHDRNKTSPLPSYLGEIIGQSYREPLQFLKIPLITTKPNTFDDPQSPMFYARREVIQKMGVGSEVTIEYRALAKPVTDLNETWWKHDDAYVMKYVSGTIKAIGKKSVLLNVDGASFEIPYEHVVYREGGGLMARQFCYPSEWYDPVALRDRVVVDFSGSSGIFAEQLRKKGIIAYGFGTLFSAEQLQNVLVDTTKVKGNSIQLPASLESKTFLVGDILTTHVADKQVDVIYDYEIFFSKALLSHQSVLKQVLREWGRVLKVGGRMRLGPIDQSKESLVRKLFEDFEDLSILGFVPFPKESGDPYSRIVEVQRIF